MLGRSDSEAENDHSIADNKLQDEDDEVITTALIKDLSREISPRVLLEDFPQSEFQAKFKS